jgi:hypothetical protein
MDLALKRSAQHRALFAKIGRNYTEATRTQEVGVSVPLGASQSDLERGVEHEAIGVFPFRMPQRDAATVVELVEPELGVESYP